MKWNFKKLKKNETIKGIYLAQYRSVGAYKKPVHEVLPSGKRERVHLWGSAVLNHELFGTTFGSLIEITYRGKGKTPESSYEVHLYDIEVLEPAGSERPIKKTKKTKK